MIGKVIRGTSAGRLLYYLYGPGRANEHTDPHLVAGFADPADLEPERRPGRSPDLRRLTGLLAQPLAALAGPGYDKPVWHCAVRAAPGDRQLTDAEWAKVAAAVMDRTGLAPTGDDLGVRWVAVRHALDHIHIVATLARQDGTRPRIWNDFYRVREACHQAEEWFGLRRTAPADRTAARRPTRAETEQAARRGWREPPRVALRREVCAAAAGASSEQEFFTRLRQAGVLVRPRHSTTHPGQITGYSVALAHHTTSSGAPVWYGGGKLAADLTLPKLRTRWSSPAGPLAGAPLPPPVARAVLRTTATTAAEQAATETDFFTRLREAGVLVRVRFSERDPEQVTGYAVTLPGHTTPDGTPCWYGGGRLSAALTLPRLRRRWAATAPTAPEHPGSSRFTAPERDAIYAHAARQAAAATGHIRHCALTNPAGAADAAWAAADTLHTAARALHNPALRRAADAYDRAARAPHARTPQRTSDGERLRHTARLLTRAAGPTTDTTLTALTLVANLIALIDTIAELRQAQHHAAQAAAARAAATHLHGAVPNMGTGVRHPGQAHGPRRSGAAPHGVIADEFPAPPQPGPPPQPGQVTTHPRRPAGPHPVGHVGPAP